MKQTLIVTFTFFILISSYAQKKKSTWEYDGLKSEVRTLQIISYNIPAMEKTNNTIIDYTYLGEWTNYCNYSSDGAMKYLEMPIYDSIGNLTARYNYSFDGTHKVPKHNYCYTYDRFGNVLQSAKKTATDTMLRLKKYEYDTKGNCITTEIFDSIHTLIKSIKYKYNKADLLITKETLYTKDNSVQTTIYQYDTLGNNIQTQVLNKGKLHTTTVYKYDKNKNVILIKQHDSNGKLLVHKTYEYQYDLSNNWVQKTEYINNTKTRITQRGIIYY